MGMKNRDGRFFILDSGKEIWIHMTEQDAVTALKNLVKNQENLNPERMCLLETNTIQEQWEIKVVPWSNIALVLLKSE